jgi:hypothetical protein
MYDMNSSIVAIGATWHLCRDLIATPSAVERKYGCDEELDAMVGAVG